MLINSLEKTQHSDLKVKAAIYIALFGGLHKGEILGLNWEDVDWETCMKILLRLINQIVQYLYL